MVASCIKRRRRGRRGATKKPWRKIIANSYVAGIADSGKKKKKKKGVPQGNRVWLLKKERDDAVGI